MSYHPSDSKLMTRSHQNFFISMSVHFLKCMCFNPTMHPRFKVCILISMSLWYHLDAGSMWRNKVETQREVWKFEHVHNFLRPLHWRSVSPKMHGKRRTYSTCRSMINVTSNPIQSFKLCIPRSMSAHFSSFYIEMDKHGLNTMVSLHYIILT